MRRPVVIIPAPADDHTGPDLTGFAIGVLGCLTVFGTGGFLAYGLSALGWLF